jgi:hypothetical protein
MTISQARLILGFSEEAGLEGLDKAAVMEHYAKLFELNDPSDGGSLYIQAKVYHAKETLLEELGVPHEERELPEHTEPDEEQQAEEQDRGSGTERR